MTPVLILAGGLGTRLRPIVGDTPKPMAEIAGRPFLHWLLAYLERQGVSDVYLSVGYRHDVIQAALSDQFGALRLHYIVEDEPLGTGGAIQYALASIPSDEVLIVNGDTLAVLDLTDFVAQAQAQFADLAIGLIHVAQADRYGTVDVHPATHRVQAFMEKGKTGAGWINAGVYLLRKSSMMAQSLPSRFSFEQDFMASCVKKLNILGLPIVRDFIDIGVPQDFTLAQTKIPALMNSDVQISSDKINA